jgi:hypothetical protein
VTDTSSMDCQLEASAEFQKSLTLSPAVGHYESNMTTICQ